MVTPASPCRPSLVWSAARRRLAKFYVAVDPETISVSVNGTPAQIEALRNTNPGQTGIHAYLDLTEEDRPSQAMVYRLVRYVPPQGITVTSRRNGLPLHTQGAPCGALTSGDGLGNPVSATAGTHSQIARPSQNPGSPH